MIGDEGLVKHCDRAGLVNISNDIGNRWTERIGSMQTCGVCSGSGRFLGSRDELVAELPAGEPTEVELARFEREEQVLSALAPASIAGRMKVEIF